MSTFNSPVNVEPVTLVRSSNINDLDAAVAEAFAFLPDETLLKQGKHLYAVDTGTANTHVVALPVSPGSYVDGLSFTFKAKTSNTGGCTVNVNSIGVAAISREDGTDLVTGDIVAGQMCTVRYNVATSKFQLEGTNAASSALAAAASAVASAASAVESAAQADIAKVQAGIATSAAATAVNAPGTSSTSTSSISLTAGTKTFTTQTGKYFPPGGSVKFAYASNLSKWAVGTVDSYNSGTGQLVLIVDANDINGSGTYSDWVLSVSGHRGALGSSGITNMISSATSYTLTTSATFLRMTPTGHGVTVYLPDATGMTPIDPVYAIVNESQFPIRIVDSTGVLKGFVPIFDRADISLISSSPAGVWGLKNVRKVGISAELSNSSASGLSTASGPQLLVVAIDSDRDAIFFGGTSLYVVAYSKSSNTFGSITLVRSGIAWNSFAPITAILQMTNQILAISSDSTTGLEAVTITFSGTSATVNSGTKATATASANFNQFGNIVSVNGSFAFSQSTSTNVHIVRGVSVSGTTPTIGAENTLTTAVSQPPYLLVTGTNLRAVSSDNSQVICKPFTISGSTLTAGTQAAVTASQFTFKTFVNQSGNVVCLYLNTTAYATIFKLTGTVVTASTVAVGNSSTINGICHIEYSSTKTAVASMQSSTQVNIIIVTDTSGTASASSYLTHSVRTNSNTTPVALGYSGTSVRFGYEYSTGQVGAMFTYDCSGATPTINAQTYSSIVQSQAATSPQGTLSELPINQFQVGGENYFIGSGMNMTRYGTSSISMMPSMIGISPTARATNNAQAWAAVQVGSNGINLKLIEVCA